MMMQKELENESEILRGSVIKNSSRFFVWSEFRFNINKNNIASYVALTKEFINLESLEDICRLLDINYNNFYDYRTNHKTLNMLIIPTLNYKKM